MQSLGQLGINAMPQELSMLLKAQVADLQNQMKLMQEMVAAENEPMLSRTPSHDNEPDQMIYNNGLSHPTPPCPTPLSFTYKKCSVQYKSSYLQSAIWLNYFPENF